MEYGEERSMEYMYHYGVLGYWGIGVRIGVWSNAVILNIGAMGIYILT